MSSICDNQENFSKAVTVALSSNRYINMGTFILYMALLIWAVFLAMKVADRDHRILHIFSAIIAPPLYIISSCLSG